MCQIPTVPRTENSYCQPVSVLNQGRLKAAPFSICSTQDIAVLQIRRGNRVNLGRISHISP